MHAEGGGGPDRVTISLALQQPCLEGDQSIQHETRMSQIRPMSQEKALGSCLVLPQTRQEGRGDGCLG
jgi:hypothetical protein